MKKLTMDAFLSSLDDIETAKYKILAIIKQYRKLFQQNKIYPYLAELIEIGYVLAQMSENKPDIPENIGEELIQINLYETQDTYNSIYLTVDEYNDFFTLVAWTLPFLEETVDEGKIIYKWYKGFFKSFNDCSIKKNASCLSGVFGNFNSLVLIFSILSI